MLRFDKRPKYFHKFSIDTSRLYYYDQLRGHFRVLGSLTEVVVVYVIQGSGVKI